MNGLAQSRRRLVLADGDALARAHLVQLLAELPDLAVLAGVSTLEQLRAVVAEERPELVLTELALADGSVLPWLRELAGETTRPRVLVLSADRGADSVLAAVAAGADGYVLKEHARTELGGWLNAVLNGQQVLDQMLTRVIFQGYRDAVAGGAAPAAGGEATLSARAQDVLELMAAGLRNREIAERLGLSEHTVKVYVAQVFAFLGVSDRTAAVMAAIRRGLVRPPLRDVRNLNER